MAYRWTCDKSKFSNCRFVDTLNRECRSKYKDLHIIDYMFIGVNIIVARSVKIKIGDNDIIAHGGYVNFDVTV